MALIPAAPVLLTTTPSHHSYQKVPDMKHILPAPLYIPFVPASFLQVYQILNISLQSFLPLVVLKILSQMLLIVAFGRLSS